MKFSEIFTQNSLWLNIFINLYNHLDGWLNIQKMNGDADIQPQIQYFYICSKPLSVTIVSGDIYRKLLISFYYVCQYNFEDGDEKILRWWMFKLFFPSYLFAIASHRYKIFLPLLKTNSISIYLSKQQGGTVQYNKS